MADKSSRWQFTAYEEQFSLFTSMPPGVQEWGWQEETCPKTQRLHYQGYVRLVQQQRFAWMRKTFPGVHIEIARNWDALVNYCKKEETRVEGAQHVHKVNDIPNHYQYAEEISLRIAQRFVTSPLPEFDWRTWTTAEALIQIETLVHLDIASGRTGLEWICSNPQFIAMFKKYWKPCIERSLRQTDRQTTIEIIPEDYNGSCSTPSPDS